MGFVLPTKWKKGRVGIHCWNGYIVIIIVLGLLCLLFWNCGYLHGYMLKEIKNNKRSSKSPHWREVWVKPLCSFEGTTILLLVFFCYQACSQDNMDDGCGRVPLSQAAFLWMINRCQLIWMIQILWGHHTDLTSII